MVDLRSKFIILYSLIKKTNVTSRVILKDTTDDGLRKNQVVTFGIMFISLYKQIIMVTKISDETTSRGHHTCIDWLNLIGNIEKFHQLEHKL